MFSALSPRTRAKEYPVVIKGDVQGSVEAIVRMRWAILSTDEIKVRVLQSGVGAITESDMLLAQRVAARRSSASTCVRTPRQRELAKRHKVRLKYFDVIYHLTEDIAKEMAGESGSGNHRNRRRPCRSQGRVQIGQARQGSRSAGHRRRYQEGPVHARLTREDVIVSKTTSPRCAASRTMSTKSARAWNAVWSWDTNDIKAGDMLEVFEVEERERTPRRSRKPLTIRRLNAPRKQVAVCLTVVCSGP
jgi:translation initiation factor IF-2